MASTIVRNNNDTRYVYSTFQFSYLLYADTSFDFCTNPHHTTWYTILQLPVYISDARSKLKHTSDPCLVWFTLVSPST